MTKTFFMAAALLAANPAHAQVPAPPVSHASAPIVVAGTVSDEASKAALLARLRTVYGVERVVDQLAVGNVATPADWNDHVGRLIGPNLKMISRGQLKVDGNTVSLRGDVASEAQRQQIAGDIAASLNPTYTVNNGLRVSASEQGVLDAALANRIIEFESGKAALTPSGHDDPRPDERGAQKTGWDQGRGDRPHRQRRLARRQPVAQPGARGSREGLCDGARHPSRFDRGIGRRTGPAGGG